MKYVAIDLETSGLDPEKHDILEIAVVIEDTNTVDPVDELPFFRRVLLHKEITGQPAALQMNNAVLKRIQEGGEGCVRPEMLFNELFQFLAGHLRGQRIVFAGKNAAGFDIPFLKNHPRFELFQLDIDSRVLDPAVLYCNWEDDIYPPSLSQCKERAGLDDTVAHRALADARDVIKLLRKATNNYERGFTL